MDSFVWRCQLHVLRHRPNRLPWQPVPGPPLAGTTARRDHLAARGCAREHPRVCRSGCRRRSQARRGAGEAASPLLPQPHTFPSGTTGISHPPRGDLQMRSLSVENNLRHLRALWGSDSPPPPPSRGTKGCRSPAAAAAAGGAGSNPLCGQHPSRPPPPPSSPASLAGAACALFPAEIPSRRRRNVGPCPFPRAKHTKVLKCHVVPRFPPAGTPLPTCSRRSILF